MPGVALAGDAERGTKTTEGISLLFTAAGVTVQGPQPQIERLLVWSALDSATCREKIQLPDGRDAADHGTDVGWTVDPIPPPRRHRVARTGRLSRPGPAGLAARVTRGRAGTGGSRCRHRHRWRVSTSRRADATVAVEPCRLRARPPLRLQSPEQAPHRRSPPTGIAGRRRPRVTAPAARRQPSPPMSRVDTGRCGARGTLAVGPTTAAPPRPRERRHRPHRRCPRRHPQSAGHLSPAVPRRAGSGRAVRTWCADPPRQRPGAELADRITVLQAAARPGRPGPGRRAAPPADGTVRGAAPPPPSGTTRRLGGVLRDRPAGTEGDRPARALRGTRRPQPPHRRRSRRGADARDPYAPVAGRRPNRRVDRRPAAQAEPRHCGRHASGPRPPPPPKAGPPPIGAPTAASPAKPAVGDQQAATRKPKFALTRRKGRRCGRSRRRHDGRGRTGRPVRRCRPGTPTGSPVPLAVQPPAPGRAGATAPYRAGLGAHRPRWGSGRRSARSGGSAGVTLADQRGEVQPPVDGSPSWWSCSSWSSSAVAPTS